MLPKDKNLCMSVYKTKPVLHLKPTQFVFVWKVELKPKFPQSAGECSFEDWKRARIDDFQRVLTFIGVDEVISLVSKSVLCTK